MRQCPWWLSLACSVLVVGVFLSVIPVRTAEGFKAEIERALPVGTPRSEIYAWLDSRGLKVWKHIVQRPVGRALGCRGFFNRFLLPIPGIADVLWSIYWDEEGRLTRVSVEVRR
jgi:hypothetical protein